MTNCWNKTNVRAWLRAFEKKHHVVPTAKIRKRFHGPTEKDLKELFGGSRQAYKACGIKLKDGNAESAIRYEDTMEVAKLREDSLRAQSIIIKCALCNFRGEYLDARVALEAQTKHMVKHGKKRNQKWKNPPLPSLPGSIPGVMQKK